ncbi:hypothetical protein LINPERHAP2_LOCUS26651 [Linum perenne]
MLSLKLHYKRRYAQAFKVCSSFEGMLKLQRCKRRRNKKRTGFSLTSHEDSYKDDKVD